MVEYGAYEIQSRGDSRDPHRGAFGRTDCAPRRDSHAGTGARGAARCRSPSRGRAARAVAQRALQYRHFSNRSRHARIVSSHRCRGPHGGAQAALEQFHGGGPRTEARRRTECSRGANRHTGCLAVHHGDGPGGARAPAAAGSACAGATLWCGESGAVRSADASAVPACRRLPLTDGHCRRTPGRSTHCWTRWRSSSVDAVVFTSAVQIHNLHAVAAQSGRAAELARPAESLGHRIDRAGLFTGPAGTWDHALIRSQSAETWAAGRRPRRGFVSPSPTVISVIR